MATTLKKFINLLGYAMLVIIVLATITAGAVHFRPTEVKRFVEAQVNSVMYWHYVHLPREVTQKGRYCIGERCVDITLEFAAYGAPQISIGSNIPDKDDWSIRIHNGVDGDAWRIREVHDSYQQTHQLINPKLFVAESVRTHLATYGREDLYTPQGPDDLSHDATIIRLDTGGDSPHDSFALTCPQRVMTGFTPSICSRDYDGRRDVGFSYIPPKPAFFAK